MSGSSTTAGLEIVRLDASPHTWVFDERPREIGTGVLLRRDFVLVRVELADGTIGYGEAFHGHAASAVAEIINTTFQDSVIGRKATEVTALREEIRDRFLISNGIAHFLFALSGIDIAMWDAYGKSVRQPAWRLLGGLGSSAPAYAGGFTLGYSTPRLLVDDLAKLHDQGYRAAKIRVGDSFEGDSARLVAVREAFGPDFGIMTDANLGLNYDTTRLAPVLEAVGAQWLEEPFTPRRREKYRRLSDLGHVALAAGENIFGADSFVDWIDDGCLQVVQPDASRVGGITESLRVAHLAQAHGVRFVPHISHTALNHAATMAVIAATGSRDFFEADPTAVNPLRNDVVHGGVVIEDGRAHVVDSPGLGVDVDDVRLRTDFIGQKGSPWPRIRRPS